MKKNDNLRKFTKLLIHILIVLVFEVYIQSTSNSIHQNIKLIIGIIILLILIISYIYNKKKKLTSTNITNIIIIIGILLRTMYIIYTPITERQHDVGDFDDAGHLSYINTIYETGRLPETNEWQYYHPPLHHFLSAVWLKTNEVLFNVPSIYVNIEGLQILTLLFSSLTLFVISQILSRLKIKNIYKYLTVLFFSVNPTMIILSGSINNDCLEYLIQFMILLYMLKYYESPTSKNSLILGIITGLCMLTKFNGIIMLGPITILFLYKLYKERNFKEIIKNYSIVLVIALVLGLSYQIRNYILFGSISIPNPTEHLSVKQYSIFKRMIIPSFTNIYEKFCNLTNDYNIFSFIVKNSIFGEYKYNIPNIFYNLYVSINLLLIILSTVLLIKNIKTIFKDKINLLLISNYVITMLSFYYFNYMYPYTCTMDFRYIVPTLLTGIVMLVMESNKTKSKYIRYLIDIPIILFIVLSIIFIFII